jgi:hypothetical protein
MWLSLSHPVENTVITKARLTSFLTSLEMKRRAGSVAPVVPPRGPAPRHQGLGRRRGSQSARLRGLGACPPARPTNPSEPSRRIEQPSRPEGTLSNGLTLAQLPPSGVFLYCYQSVAQSPDGLPLLFTGSTWQEYTTDLPRRDRLDTVVRPCCAERPFAGDPGGWTLDRIERVRTQARRGAVSHVPFPTIRSLANHLTAACSAIPTAGLPTETELQARRAARNAVRFL